MKYLVVALGLSSALVSSVTFAAERTVSVRRVFRPARVTRGNTNIVKTQPMDHAHWIWAKDVPYRTMCDRAFLKFRNRFTLEKPATVTFDVSADERFYLTLDGNFVARGPNRAEVENWQYQTYEVDLAAGEHVLAATVWRTLDSGPLAQFTWFGGFVLKAEGELDKVISTGLAPWEAGVLTNIVSAGRDNGVWGTGDQWQITGTGLYAAEPAEWKSAITVRGPVGSDSVWNLGLRPDGWMLFPTQLPDQTEYRVAPGAVKATTQEVGFRQIHRYAEADTRAAWTTAFNALLKEGTALTVPSNSRVQVAWDLGRYYCAYPELKTAGGKGAKVSWCWTEATRRWEDKCKGPEPDARNTIIGRFLDGYGDIFVADGRADAVFSSPWFRCGKWCRLDVETGDEPLTITGLKIIESRYPLEMESAFVAPEDPSLQDIRRISLRSMQMCCHEMLFDCPYYEQQMYPGDTRVQLNVLSALSQDERIIKRAMEIYDIGTRDDGQCPFNWPTRCKQEGASYTLCYLLMYGDYVMNHADRAWLKARLPGLRKSMAGMEMYERADGLLENLPGWQFMDWTVGWDGDGVAPGGRFGEGVNAELNLLWSLAMRSAAITERALGHELQAQYWEEKRVRLNAAIVGNFWCGARGLLADTPAMKNFSEHAQCLALLGDVLPADDAATCFAHLIADADLKRTTVYFNYYLFDCYFKFGRGDLFLQRLDLWRTYVKKGLTTAQEAPDSGRESRNEARSDCHAWGAHPIWFMQTGIAGIQSAAPFFAKVRVAPCPGTLTSFTAKHPHPQGFVEVELKFADGKATGVVRTPVPGEFVFGDQRLELKAGVNAIN